MKFSEFKKMDPDLAGRLIDNAKEMRSISDWQQKLWDKLVVGLKKRGASDLGLVVYEDEVRTEYMSLLEEAKIVGDPAMKRIVAHLEDGRKRFEPCWKERDQIYDEILEKHGLEVAVLVGVDGELEDEFEFTEISCDERLH